MKIFNSHEYITRRTKGVLPAFRYDGKESLQRWQAKSRAKLLDLLGLPFEKCEDDFSVLAKKQKENYCRVEFTFQSEVGYYVSGDLLIPNGIKRPLPGVICLQGHSTGKHISLGEVKFPEDEEDIVGGRDFAVRAVQEGFCAVTLEQRYMGTAGQEKTEGTPSCLSDNEGMATLLLGRTAIGERVWDISRLIDVIETRFADYIDSDQIICLGNSGGGTATFYAACVDERIRIAVPSCAVCTYEDSIMAMQHCPCNFIPGIRKYFDMGDLGGLIVGRAFVMVCGKEDPIFPLHGTRKAYETIARVYHAEGKDEDCFLIEGNGGHQFYPDDTWPVIHRLLERV